LSPGRRLRRSHPEPCWSGGCGLRLAKERTKRPAGREERAFAGRSCGPLRPCRRKCRFQTKLRLSRSIPSPSSPAAERTGLRREGAALRPGAAAGCRSRSDRFCRQAFPPQLKLQAGASTKTAAASCRYFATDFAGKHFHRNRQLRARISAIRSLLGRRPFCMEAIAKRSAGRSLPAAEARSSRPAGPRRACPPQAAARIRALHFSCVLFHLRLLAKPSPPAKSP